VVFLVFPDPIPLIPVPEVVVFVVVLSVDLVFKGLSEEILSSTFVDGKPLHFRSLPFGTEGTETVTVNILEFSIFGLRKKRGFTLLEWMEVDDTGDRRLCEELSSPSRSSVLGRVGNDGTDVNVSLIVGGNTINEGLAACIRGRCAPVPMVVGGNEGISVAGELSVAGDALGGFSRFTLRFMA